MEKILNRILDLPSEINGKLPMNCWNGCMSDSEGNLAKWAGEVFRVGAFVTLVCSVWHSVMGIGGEGMAMAMSGLGALVWIYVAFPVAQIVRNAGDAIASSKSDIVTLLWHDIALESIKAWGYVTALVALVALAIPYALFRRRSGSSPVSSSDSEDESDDEEGPAEETAVAPPSKISVAIVSTIDGKTANVKVPSNMPVNKLLQNCVGKFPLPHANFAVMLNGVAVDNNLTLADAGLTDKCQVDLVPLE